EVLAWPPPSAAPGAKTEAGAACAPLLNLARGGPWGPGEGGVMSGRSGPFWDSVNGRAPVPRAAQTLGLEFIDADVEDGTIELAFAATEAFTNPTGNGAGRLPGGDAVRHHGAGAAGNARTRRVS